MASGYEKRSDCEPRIGIAGVVFLAAIVLLAGTAALGWLFV